MLGLKSAKLAKGSDAPPAFPDPVPLPAKGSFPAKGSLENGSESGFGLGVALGLGGAGRGGGCFFVLGGRAGFGDSFLDVEDMGAKGSLPNRSELTF